MYSFNVKAIRLGAVALTLLAIGIYPFVPDKTLTLLPHNQTMAITYSDQWDGGDSRHRWFNKEALTFECIMRKSEVYNFCGIAIKFYDQPKPAASDDQRDIDGITGIDLSDYHGIKIRVQYQGAAKRIRYAMRNVEFPFNNVDQIRQAKQMETFLQADEFNHDTYIDFELLNISDWWIAENNIRRENTRPAFENIMEMIFHFPSSTPEGRHLLTIEEITAQGKWLNKECLYLGLAIFWALFVLAEIILQSLKLRHEKELVGRSLKTLKREYESLKTSAQQDALTDTLNRAGIDAFAQALLRSDTTNVYWLSLFNIDDYKRLINTYGLTSCEALLQDIVSIFRSAMEGGEEIGRWNEETFVLFSAGGNRHTIYERCEKIRRAIARTTFYCGNNVITGVTISFGITRLDVGTTIEHSYKSADKALQSAIHNGQNQGAVAVY